MRNPPGTSGGHLVYFLNFGVIAMARKYEVEFPVLVTVTIPDGVEIDSVDLVDAAWQVVPQSIGVCIKEEDGKPVEFAECFSEVLAEETKVDGLLWNPPQSFYA
jgi:hypothetical protein